MRVAPPIILSDQQRQELSTGETSGGSAGPTGFASKSRLTRRPSSGAFNAAKLSTTLRSEINLLQLSHVEQFVRTSSERDSAGA